MADILLYVFGFALLALVVVGGIWVLRSYLDGASPRAAIFGPRPDRRLAVVEQASVDGRRRLVIVRRDDVEHLIMTGGPVDVVIETGINLGRGRASGEPPALQSVYARTPRTFGQAGERSGENAAE